MRGAGADPAVEGDAKLRRDAGLRRAGAKFGGDRGKSNREQKHER